MRGGPVLVTGGAGFLGANLVDRLAALGHDVRVFDTLSRPGVETNLAWLMARHPRRIAHIREDVRNAEAVARAVTGASAVFHFAAQVAVTTSLEDPGADFAINLGGAFNVLQAARARPAPPPILFASTNKVYGDLADVALRCDAHGYAPLDPALRDWGVNERRPLDFRTPYGCSKGAADQYVLDYARSFGVPAAAMRMSCIYGPRQFGTEDQGWVAHFLIRALAGRPVTLYGDGHQVRDVLFVNDAVDAYLAAWSRIEAISGRAFNLGGGPANAVSLRAMLAHAEALIGRPVVVEERPWRPGDQRWYVSDPRAVSAALEVAPLAPWRSGVARLLEWLRESGVAAARLAASGVAP